MTGNVSISEAPTTGLGKLINENRFFVPTHQRDYRWEQEKVQKLFDDLTESMDRKDRFYFIGLMVFMGSEDGRLRVLDGQQRLATTIIILSALRAWFGASESEGSTSSQIQYDFIGRTEYGEKQPLPKMHLNYNNDDLFQKYVVNSSPLPEIKAALNSFNKNASNYRLLDAIAYCHARITQIAEKHADSKKTTAYFADLLKYIRDSVVVVRLTVPNAANAFRVFETLNDRGLDLSAVDLVKNHLFGLAHDQSTDLLAQLEKRWAQITQELQNVKEEEFLRVYWTSRNGRTQLEDVFEGVQEKYKTGSAAAELSVDLLEAAEHYAALEASTDPIWTPYPPDTRETIASLRLLGAKQVKPVVLSALKKFDQHEFGRLLKLLETIIVRWQLIGEERTGAIEIQCARLAHLIWTQKVKRASDARSALETIYINDDSFRASFAEKDGLSNQKAVYLLKRIEEHERRARHGKELSPTSSLTLEHILPRNPDAWQEALAADFTLRDYVSRLGNLCLLTETKNRDVGRSPFEEKKKIFEKSELLTTNGIAKYQAWDRKAIEDRQLWLASKAVAIWRFP
ncbi:DUF262 domain-containing HNH endonuclease family protein [Bradyrhizobium sp. UFLA05-153]